MTYKEKYELTRKSLIDLLSWSTSGKRYQSTNPYMILPIKNAMKALTEIDGKKDYLDLPLYTNKYDSGELKV
jgi:hypothetical protein